MQGTGFNWFVFAERLFTKKYLIALYNIANSASSDVKQIMLCLFPCFIQISLIKYWLIAI